MISVRLHGALGRDFGREHRFDVASIPEVMQALVANFPGVPNAMRNGKYRVWRNSDRTGMDESEVVSTRLRDGDTVHIAPALEGRGRGGLGKILAGVFMVGLAMFTGGSIAATGALQANSWLGGIALDIGKGMILGGVAQLIAPSPDVTNGDENKSYTSTGPQVTTREGAIVPIVYGEVVTGGVMISGALEVRPNVGQTDPFTYPLMNK